VSSSRPCRLLTTGGLSLALALTAPGVALADHKQGHDDGRPGAGQQAQQSSSNGTGTSASNSNSNSNSNSSSHSKGSSKGSGASKGSSSASQGSKGKGAGSSQGRSSAGKSGSAGQSKKAGSSGRAAAQNDSGRVAGGDPRGNNGTVKVDGQPFDDGRGNEPHVGCVFAVDFYGFDDGDAATITLTGQAPTGGGLLHSQHSVISDDAAGGGQDSDATLVFSVQDQLSELLSIAPHPQQGWHVKLAVDVDSAPGGAKQKVFWIDCQQPAAVSGTSASPATGGAGESVTGTAEDVTVDKRDITETPILPTFGQGSTEVTESDAAVAGTTLLAAQGSAAQGSVVRGSAVRESAASGGAEAVAAQGTVRPQALPFTGAQALLGLLALGLGALGAGGAAARLGSRRAAQG
jgi:hypothetical protein